MATAKKVKLADLLINTENFRFETVASQKEAIDKMIENQGEYLFNLAEHILKYGLNPNDKIQTIVSHHDNKKFIVLEGNRRTVSLKLLSNPDLIEDLKKASLKKKFRKLNTQNPGAIPSSIDVVIYDDPKEADIWIGIKHGYGKSGIGTDGWDPLQKQRFGEKTEGKTSSSIQIIKLLKKSSLVPIEIKNKIETISTTNVDRLIADPEVRDFLGIEFNNGVLQSGIEEPEVIKGLVQVVKDILDPKFTVKKIYNKEDRKDYLKKFPKTSKPNLNIKSPKPWQFTKDAPETGESSNKPKPKPLPKERTKLIPKSCSIQITNPKVNSIYHELRDLDVVKYTNAVAVLFRVFVELSVDCYIDSNKLVKALSASSSNANLQQKVNLVADNLDGKKLADSAITKGVKAAIKEKNDLLGIDTLHAYVHNNKFSPKSDNMIITWDNIQDFIIILWNNIK